MMVQIIKVNLSLIKIYGDGAYCWIDGKKYHGQLINGKKENYGITSYSNGDRYEGEYKNGERAGYGCYTQVSNGEYSGYWLNGLKHGLGIQQGNA